MQSQIKTQAQKAQPTPAGAGESIESILEFTLKTKPDYKVNWHHELLCQYLDKFISGQLKRLMVFMPPRHGKSELVSRRLPAFIFGKKPDSSIISCSYSADLSSRMNRDVQRIIDSQAYINLFPGTKLSGSNIRTVAHGSYLRNSDIFEIVNKNGSYRSAGVGGGITGMGFDYGIIDDPVKRRKEAESRTFRDSVWEWYTSDFYTRQEGDAGILLTTTRWHEDDLAGRILKSENSESWTVVSFPALFEPDKKSVGDPRKEGQALWPDKFGEKRLNEIRSTLGSYQWLGLYQQRPSAREGNRIKRAWFKFVDAVPVSGTRRVRYWDKAGSDEEGAYTVGLLMSRSKEALYYVEDIQRGQWSALERERTIKNTAILDSRRGRVEIWHEQEPGSGGKESAEATTRNLAGYVVHADKVTGDKDTRLDPFEAQLEAGNVYLVRGDWNESFIDELCAIPNGKFRDQGDGASGAFNKLAKGNSVKRGASPFDDFRG